MRGDDTGTEPMETDLPDERLPQDEPLFEAGHRWINYHHLFYFWCVSREMTIAKAALKLRLSRQAVGLQVQQFERALGSRLFLRDGRKLELTEAGRLVQRYADEIFGLGRELVHALESLRVEKPSRLVVGILDSIPPIGAQRIIAPLLRGPLEVHLSCRMDKLEPLLAALFSHAVDLVIADSPLPAEGPLRAYSHLLGECPISLLASRELAERLAPGAPRSLKGAPFLMPQEGSMMRTTLDQWLRSHRIRPRIVAEFDDSQLMIDFGREGAGIFAVSGMVEEKLVQDSSLRRIHQLEGVHDRVYVITRSRSLKHPAVIELLRASREELFGR